jgi:hypothetical protein
VDDVLRQGEHIPKMQNDIGRKSTLAVLRWTGRTMLLHNVAQPNVNVT